MGRRQLSISSWFSIFCENNFFVLFGENTFWKGICGNNESECKWNALNFFQMLWIPLCVCCSWNVKHMPWVPHWIKLPNIRRKRVVNTCLGKCSWFKFRYSLCCMISLSWNSLYRSENTMFTWISPFNR